MDRKELLDLIAGRLKDSPKIETAEVVGPAENGAHAVYVATVDGDDWFIEVTPA